MDSSASTILFVDSFTTGVDQISQPSSDAIGYGITSADAIRRGLQARGYRVVRPHFRLSDHTDGAACRSAWTIACYEAILRTVSSARPDVIMCFHAFGPFPAEIRRMALDLGLRVPIIGYTHGSHWDPSDSFRTIRYPGMQLVDLANLHVMQRVLLVSEYLRLVLLEQISRLSRELADDLRSRMVVVGLPLDTELIDACHDRARSDRTTIVYNHAPIDSKQPALFVDAMGDVLDEWDVDILLTRAFPDSGRLRGLTDRFGERLICGEDLPLKDYYRWLWRSDIQVSTATHESLGIATLEAMYTENYCIVPRVGSYPEILGDDYEALYDGSRRELVQHIKSAIACPPKRRAVARDLSRLAHRYHPNIITSRLAAVIDDVVVEAGQSPQKR